MAISADGHWVGLVVDDLGRWVLPGINLLEEGTPTFGEVSTQPVGEQVVLALRTNF